MASRLGRLDAQHIWDNRSRAIEKAQQETANLARSLAPNAEDTIEAANANLVAFAQRPELDGAAPEKMYEHHKIMAVHTNATSGGG